ncbi:MAG: ABC transporter permease [Xanthomonadaceae bacterium]|nr:ABC transporter permease [Xanthomonadaceae bacterium]
MNVSILKSVITSTRLSWVRGVAFRYLSSKKSTQYLSFITWISVLGVLIGVTAMGVVLSVMEGFEGELKKRLMNTELHILITPKPTTRGFEQGMIPERKIDTSRFPSLELFPILQTEAILKSGRRVTGVIAKGIPPERMDLLKTQMIEKADPALLSQREGSESYPPSRVFVGKEMAYEMGLIPGDFVTLVSPTETEGPMSLVPRLKRFVVAGIYSSGMPEQELHTVFMDFGAVRSFLRHSTGITHWEGRVDDLEEASILKVELEKQLPDLKVQDWKDLNAALFFSLKLERILMFIALSFIILVASFNIVTTLTLMVQEKRREIAILKTMGATTPHIGGIFLVEGLTIGGLGTLLGTVTSFTVCQLLKRYQFITLPDIYYDRSLPVIILPSYFAGIFVTALIIVMSASIIPALRVARLDPLTGIRN